MAATRQEVEHRNNAWNLLEIYLRKNPHELDGNYDTMRVAVNLMCRNGCTVEDAWREAVLDSLITM